jgi:hypothetical protein
MKRIKVRSQQTGINQWILGESDIRYRIDINMYYGLTDNGMQNFVCIW